MAIECADCGVEQTIPTMPARSAARCVRCNKLLDLSEGLDLTIGLAWTLAIFLLLIPANTLPLISASVGVSTKTTTIHSAIAVLWNEQWPILSILFCAYTLVFPFLRAGMLLAVLGGIATNHKPRWLGRIYRWSENIRLWAMPDVLVLAGLVLYMRTNVQLSGYVGWGGWCLIAAAALSMLTPLVLAPHHVWREIMPDNGEPEDEDAISCDACNLILPISKEGTKCPRCRRRLHLRKPNSMQRTGALVAASYILYFPSYYYAMSYTFTPKGLQYHSIIQGVSELKNAGFWMLAGIIFTVSILIPFTKLVCLSWFLLSVYYPSKKTLLFRTKLYRVVHKIGRWSNMDPFIVAIMAPLLSFTGLVSVHVGKAALPFALVVMMTMLAARSFDPRLMWDAAEGHL